MKRAFLLFLSAAAALRADSTATKTRTVTKLADGVYEIRHPDAPDTFPQSNTTVVIGDRGVLVVDSGLLPSTAREDVAQIRRWTDKPVTWLLNTHWHFDHTLGNATYQAAFPAIQIVATRPTQKTIADYNPGVVTRYPSRAERFKKILDSGKGPDGRPLSEGDRKDYERSLAGLAPVVAEFRNAVQVPPNVAFDRELTIDLGNRHGRAALPRARQHGRRRHRVPAEGEDPDHGRPSGASGPLSLRRVPGRPPEDAPGHGRARRADDRAGPRRDPAGQAVHLPGRRVPRGRGCRPWRTRSTRARRSRKCRTAFPKSFDVKTWRARFAGTSLEEGEAFDGTFDGVVKGAYTQIKMR